MRTMDHHLSNGDAAAVELQSMIGDSSVPETSYGVRATKQLPFSVVYCSDQDEDYPATELNNGVLSRGWQSSRFCYYPQEIVLELQWPSRIINMQLLSHEFKIPTKVEVFVSLIVPYVHEAIGQMKRLGYLALDCNERSGHQARELKSVYIDSPATVVRLVFHNCHCNDYNAYGQVGLMALILTGEPLDEQQWAILTQPGVEDLLQTPRKQNRNSKRAEVNIQGSSRSNPERKCDVELSIANRIVQLQEEKNSAVLDEDYDEAKRLKGLIDRLKATVEEIKQLENKKQLAVENEDYDTAKACKEEIEKLRLQEHCSNNSGQAEKRDEVSDWCVSSEESADELARAGAEGSQSEDPGLEDSAETNCCDVERKEFGTQTLHRVKSTVVKKVDKEISCKTPDLGLPPKRRPGANGLKSEKKPGLLSVVFPWWRPKLAPSSSPPSASGKHNDAFIPAMRAPNILPNIREDADMHALPTVSYKSGSSALFPVVTHTNSNSNGLHPLFNQNTSTIMGMTMNNHPSKQLSSAFQYPQAVLKSLPNFDLQNGQSPTPVVINTMCQNNRPSFPTLQMKNINFLPSMIQVPFRNQTSPIKNERTKQKTPKQCGIRLSSIHDGMIKKNEDYRRINCSNHQNIISWFGASVSDVKNVEEQVTREEINLQGTLCTQFEALEKEFDEAKNQGVIQNNEKKMKFQNNGNQQASKDQEYDEEIMNDEYNNKALTNGTYNDYYEHKMDFESMLDDGHEKALNMQIKNKTFLLQNTKYEKVQNFQNNDKKIELVNNSNEQTKNFQNNIEIQSTKNNFFEQKEINISNGEIQIVQNNENNQPKIIQNNEKMSIIQNNNYDLLKIHQNFHEMEKINQNRINQDQLLENLNINEAKKKAFDAFNPLNSINTLDNITHKELNFQKENELYAQMEKIYQQKIKMEVSKDELDKRSKKDNKIFFNTKKENHEEKTKAQKKIDVFNNNDKVIRIFNTNIDNQGNNCIQDHSKYESNNNKGFQSIYLTMSNDINLDYNSTSNHLASSKQQSWSPQKSKEDSESSQKPLVQKNILRKVQTNRGLSPKKAHLSVKERISQAAKQAIDDLVPEPLTEYQMSESAILLKLIDMHYVQCLYSKEWKLRDRALQYLVQKISNEHLSGDDLDVFRIMSKVILKGLNDKVSNVFNVALQLSKVTILKYASEVPASDLRNCVNDLVNILFEKLGDSNPRTKDAATKALIFIATKKEIGLPVIATPLLKPPKNQAIWRPILGRLQLILLAIPTFGLQPPNKLGLQTDLLMAFVDQAFSNANGEVRNIAVKITTEVYRLMGSPIEKYLKNVKPVIREVLIRNFEKVSQEPQLEQENVLKGECFSDIPTPPLKCIPKVMEISYDERCVGPSKASKNLVGKVTMDGEIEDQNASQNEASHFIRPNKKPIKNLKKHQPLILSEESVPDSNLDGHEKQKLCDLMEY